MTEGQQGDVETERHRKPAHFHFLYRVVQGDPSPPGRELVDVKPAGGRQEARGAGSVGWGGRKKRKYSAYVHWRLWIWRRRRTEKGGWPRRETEVKDMWLTLSEVVAPNVQVLEQLPIVTWVIIIRLGSMLRRNPDLWAVSAPSMVPGDHKPWSRPLNLLWDNRGSPCLFEGSQISF